MKSFQDLDTPLLSNCVALSIDPFNRVTKTSEIPLWRHFGKRQRFRFGNRGME